MSSIDLTPFYRNSIGFDRLASLIDSAMTDSTSPGYPPYDIEIIDENTYSITLAVAGFEQKDLDIHVEKNVLLISGKKQTTEQKKYVHQGIAKRSFERKFNLADHVEVTGADLKNGLLIINLFREIPEAVKPKRISINGE